MDCYLLIDFGSTYTKLTLVDIDKEEILGTSKSYTTVETDVTEGYENALALLYESIDSREEINIVKKLACSSAAGGLKIIAIGLVLELTAEAAKRAALGAGARIIKTYSHELNNQELEEIKGSDADIILLAGGTDGGNSSCIMHNSDMLIKHRLGIPVVIAGNKSANDYIIESFNKANMECYVTENVMPSLNKINVEPARETIRNIFMNKIVDAKGMSSLEDEISGIIMPTPAAVLKSAEVLSQGTKDEKGIGDLAVVDIGGATTDIHSIGHGLPTKASVMYRGLPEPMAKRTVEGDLGMRYSALSVYEAAGSLLFGKYLNIEDYDLREELNRRYENTSFISREENDIDFDEAMAKVCTDLAMLRHAGVVEQIYTPLGGAMFSQRGKDLMEIKYILGTGGVLVNSKDPAGILAATKFTMDSPESLKPRNPSFLIDKSYILSSMGLLSTIDENMAVRILKKYIVKCGGKIND